MSIVESPIPSLADEAAVEAVEAGLVTPVASTDSADHHNDSSVSSSILNGGVAAAAASVGGDENDQEVTVTATSTSPSSSSKTKESKEKKHKKKKKSSRSERSEKSERSERSMRRSNSSDAALSTSTGELIPSPSAVADARRHSPVIKTSDESSHELSQGRESIVVPAALLRPTLSAGRLPGLLQQRQEGVTRSKSDVLADDTKHSTEYLTTPHPLRLDAWTEPSGTSFQVRGAHYLNNQVKRDSAPSVFRLLTVDLVKVKAGNKPLMTGVCSHPNERIQKALQRERATGIPELPPYIFCINLVIPGKSLYHMVFYFGIDDVSLLTDTSTPFGTVASRFFFGDSDRFRDNTFKLIPRIVDGNFIVRKAVGSKPAILGRKIAQTYLRTDRYLELICDIASDSVASKIVTLSIGYAKTLAVDMAFVLEGTHPSMLPEQVLGVVRLKQIDFKKRDGQRVLLE